MKQSDIIQKSEEHVLHTYNRFQIALDHGQGVRLFDADGKEYLDFMAGIAVSALGYHFPGYDEALKGQIDKLLHTSNLYYHEPMAKAAAKICESSGLSRVFFTNSGTEAIEGAIKAARKYAWLKDGKHGHEIIAMKESFHGRSVGALSVTGNDHYQDPFKPLMGGVVFAEYNDIDSVKAVLNANTCAIILETVQGEGGIFPADPEFLKEIRRICDERDLVLILDEIQCGMGRTGTMWAYEQYGIKPDILTSAKALGCGVPVGAFVLNEKLAESSLCPGDHGSTYGANPFVLTAVSTVFDLFEKHGIVEHVQEISAYLEKKLNELAAAHSCIKEQRGIGLMRGLEFDDSVKAGALAAAALENGLLIITAGHNTLRIVPPLVITEADVDEACLILDRCLADL